MSQAWISALDSTATGARSNLANAVEVLQHDPITSTDVLWYDEFLDRVLTAQSPTREWRDDDDTRLTVHMQQAIGMHGIHESVVASAVRYVARQRTRHCVREWLSTVTWDGESAIDRAFEESWGAEPSEDQPVEYLRSISRNFFVGLVARVMNPGCQLDNMVVFEGGQGIGKTEALRILGGPWYMLAAESVTGKDFFQALPGSWLVEIGELEAFSRAEHGRIKIAISTPSDKYRGSYGRHTTSHQRQCAFAGTTNRDDWGSDDTGLRRFWPVACGEINLANIKDRRAAWFAEARDLLEHGATWWETPGESTKHVQSHRQAEDVWTEAVRVWLMGRSDATSAEILAGALKFRDADMNRVAQLRLGGIMRLHGWTRKPIRRGGTEQVKAWVSPEWR